jgi:hypothetical protein
MLHMSDREILDAMCAGLGLPAWTEFTDEQLEMIANHQPGRAAIGPGNAPSMKAGPTRHRTKPTTQLETMFTSLRRHCR